MEQLTAGVSSGGSFGLKDVLHVLGKWKALIGLVTLASIGTVGAFTVFVLPKVYQASATINVSQILAGQAGGGGATHASNLQGVVDAVTTQPTMTMPTLLWEVTSPATLGAAAKALGQGYSAGALGGMVSAKPISSTDLLTISATNHSPQAAAAIANAVANAFLVREGATVTGHRGQALQVLKQQADSVKARLNTAATALATAEERPGAAASTQTQISADNGELGSLIGQYTQAKVSLQAALGAEGQLQSSLAGVPATITTSSGGSGSTPPVAQANPEYQTLSGELTNDQIQLATDKARARALYQQELGYSYAVQPQQYLAAKQAYDNAEVAVKVDEATIQAVQDQLARTSATLPVQQKSATVTVSPNPVYQGIKSSLDSAEVTVAQDRAQVAALGQEIPPLKADLATMERQGTAAQASVAAAKARVANLSAAYDTLATNITKTEIADAVSGGAAPVQLDAPATVPGAPISPKKKLDVMLAFVVGLMAGCALAFLLEQFDNTIKNPDDIRRVVGLPTLAVIPFVRS